MLKLRSVSIVVILLLLNLIVHAQVGVGGPEISYSPNGNFAAYGEFQHLHVWNLNTDTLHFEILSDRHFSDISWSPDSLYIASVTGRYVRVWNVSDTNLPIGSLVSEFEPFQNSIKSLSAIDWSPDGQYIAASSSRGQRPIEFWDATTYTLVNRTGGSIETGKIAWNPTQPIIATTNYAAGSLPLAMPAINSSQAATTICENNCTVENALRVDWNSMGDKLAIGNENGTVYVVDMNTDQPITTIELGGFLNTISWSFDDKFLVTDGSDTRIWNANTGALVETLNVNTFAVDFHPSRYELAYFDTDLGSLVTQDVSHISTQSIAALTLINATTDQDIRTLTNNDTIDIATTPNINIRANTDPATVGSVGFELTGAETHSETEAGKPYALFSDSGGDYNSWTPTLGTYTLTVTPYTEVARGGTAGTPVTITFDVIDSSQGSGASVASLDLVNADTDTVIGQLTDGQAIDYGTIGTQNLSIVANTTPATVGSVQFRLDGALIRTENIAPYAIAGDSANGTR